MGIRESLLNTITSVADSDFVRIVTSAGASSKATVRNLFKGFESNLSAKSSLSDSDYIRVVGSDNEAYKQSVASVASAVKATKAVSNLNDATTAGFYSFASGASNSPNTDYSGTLMVIDSVVTTQLASVLDRLYVRRYVNSAWDAWTLIPTRAEVDALNTKSATYTPSIYWSDGTTPTVSNVQFSYVKMGKLLWVSGRFLMDSKGSVGNSATLRFSLPSGIAGRTATPSNIGVFMPDSYSGAPMFIIRPDSNNIFIAWGAGAAYSSPKITPQYYTLFAVVPIE